MKTLIRMIMLLILVLILISACGPATKAVSEQKSAVTEIPPTTPTPTETIPALSPVEAALAKYEAGESLDVSNLSQEEFVEFSAKLAEKKNADRGVNPIVHHNEKYIDPQDLKLKDYDGHPNLNETIEMFIPIVGKDEYGNLQFENKGEIVTIPGSANVDWNMVISDPNDTRIDWPKTKPVDGGLPEVQDKIDYFGMVLNPMVFLDKKVGELKLDGKVGQNIDPLSTLAFYDIETDVVGNPVLARMILTLGLDYNLFEEGGTLDVQSFMGQLPENSYVYQGLQENAVYYIGLNPKQKNTYEEFGYSLDGYRGIADGNKVQEMITEQETNDRDMIVTFVSLLIRKTTNTVK